MKKEKRTNIFLLFVKMLILFLMFDTIITHVPSYVGKYLVNGKYINYVIVESLGLILALIAMVLAGNSYVFKERKDGFLKSLIVGGVPIAISLASFIPNIKPAIDASIPNVVSLLFYCTAIGLFEEFMCRGWIQTEFIERNSDTFKQVCISILLSSSIFGIMHLSNIWIGGQTVFETIAQIIQATGMGFLLGSIFFRTRNIWAVAFIHGFWDFSLMLEESMQIKSCTYGTPTNSILTYKLTLSIIMTLLYIVIGLFILRKTKNEEYFKNIDTDKKKEKKFNNILILAIFVLAFFPIGNIPDDFKTYETCYEYEQISFENYDIVSQHNSNYDILINYQKSQNEIEPITDILVEENNTLNITITKKDNKLYLIDNNEEKEYELNYENVFDYEVIENNGNYIILIVTRTRSGESTAYYNDYLTKENLLSDGSIDTIINSFVEMNNIPTTYSIGYIHNKSNNYNYPLISSKTDKVIIDDNRQVLEFIEK